jgi:hypothetical protein
MMIHRDEYFVSLRKRNHETSKRSCFNREGLKSFEEVMFIDKEVTGIREEKV